MKKEQFAAAILMGGSGKRFGSKIPKQFQLLAGKPLYIHTLEAFINSGLFSQIILVCPEQYIEKVRLEIPDHITIIKGGSTRQESSYNACNSCSDSIKYISIHDAVRPFIHKRILEKNCSLVTKYDAVDTCIPATDTLIYSECGDVIEDIPPRHFFYQGQTPQTFSLSLIKKAHEHALKTKFEGTDDCSLIKHLGQPIYITKGSENNIKITNSIDISIAEKLMGLSEDIAEPIHDNLNNKIFAITGSKGTIGSSLAKAIEEQGGQVLTISRNTAQYQANLSNANEAKSIFDQIYKEYGFIDGLINCTGHFLVKNIQKHQPEDIHKLVHDNFLAYVYACQYAKIKNMGHIINVGSSSYHRGRQNYAIYSALKAAIVNFTQGLAEEYSHLFVNVINPPRVNSKMRKQFFPKEDPSLLLQPEVVANHIVQILKSEKTGLTIDIKKT